ncbi:ADP-ribose pyrophosphatase YjhB (NUDIX family) [Arcicella aurantiaca]|uniref:ADP-ribose pyrophosphatase YjhB (NUDIX family) n=2 Tax=Arcicella aurantiaca TaxID=591202 RepID=A0A316EEV0_9BACT|nr:ADP-ribose pyrophosphatase YjhB (NUDIX family) [Arcicella aurantiaca]
MFHYKSLILLLVSKLITNIPNSEQPNQMIIFINEFIIKIIGHKKAQTLSTTEFDHLIDAQLESIRPQNLEGHVMIINVLPPTINRLFSIIKTEKLSHLQSITLISENKEATELLIKSQYKVLKAAGGVVTNNFGQILMMYRLKKWDLPKGKLDKGESSKVAAIREVEEECNVKAKLGEKICTTFHTYTYKNEDILKQTKWYAMELLNDSKMKPQVEEDIEKLEWMNKSQVKAALINSYSSIRYVLKKYYDK